MDERDGFYCVPYYTGSATCRHWMMMIAHKQQQDVTANFFDSMEAGTQHRQEQARSTFLHKFFTNWHVEWRPTLCTAQTETECGFQAIAVLHVLILGIYANHQFPYIQSFIQSSYERTSQNLAAFVQNAAYMILTRDPSCWRVEFLYPSHLQTCQSVLSVSHLQHRRGSRTSRTHQPHFGQPPCYLSSLMLQRHPSPNTPLRRQLASSSKNSHVLCQHCMASGYRRKGCDSITT